MKTPYAKKEDVEHKWYVADADDQCPAVAGLGMFAGCADKDTDGVADNVDKCPDQPEVINGVDDEDGFKHVKWRAFSSKRVKTRFTAFSHEPHIRSSGVKGRPAGIPSRMAVMEGP